MKQLPVTTHKSPVIRPSQSIYLTLPISKPAMIQLKTYQQLMKLLLYEMLEHPVQIYRKQCPASIAEKEAN
ncbi:hypothetical protein T12_14143 [Trichinella patagoniensis]|uniref:Uncharacterized protein n=1 Tax=Trichinella patagoniensis TaxID=990121 RepID=A0A0V0ZXM8_9BILA|nr:hypothetical protein T12_16981 [Trichinella patagoniensis]KRY16851.1 hypothetical protein T12_14143 [Trichinella patagoniensis]